jgi:hypothetical protein
MTEWYKARFETALRPSIRYGHAASTTTSGKELVIHGGYNNDLEPTWFDDLWLVQQRENKLWFWSKVKTSLLPNEYPSARYSHTLVNLATEPAATSTRNTFYLFGGDDGGHNLTPKSYQFGKFYNDVWKLELLLLPLVGTWSKTTATFARVPSARTSHTSVVIDQSMVVFGGLTSFNDHDGKVRLIDSNEIWLMTPLQHSTKDNAIQWTKKISSSIQPTPRYGHTAVAIGKIMYVFGGKSQQLRKLYNDLWSWENGNWKLLYDQHTSSSSTNNNPVGLLYGTMNSMIRNKIGGLLLFGGASGCENRCITESKTWFFDLLTKQWFLVDGVKGDRNNINQPVHRYRHTMTKLISSTTEEELTNDAAVHHIFGGESYGNTQKYYNDMWLLKSEQQMSGYVRELNIIKSVDIRVWMIVLCFTFLLVYRCVKKYIFASQKTKTYQGSK